MTHPAANFGTVLSSLFPANVRDRLMEQAEIKKSKKTAAGADSHGNGAFTVTAFHTLNATHTGLASHAAYDSKPIADLFTAATVMFADIVQFTAWSSVREPTQVLFLLEAIYSAFDRIARRFKGK